MDLAATRVDRRADPDEHVQRFRRGLRRAPIIVVMLILELARPGGQRFTRILVNSVVASSVSFGVFFAIAGSVLLGLYEVPKYPFGSWQMLVGAALGVVTAVLAMGVVLVIAVETKVFAQARSLPSSSRSSAESSSGW
jgi:hypothetical protein